MFAPTALVCAGLQQDSAPFIRRSIGSAGNGAKKVAPGIDQCRTVIVASPGRATGSS
jgi:hypothetical protein